eukprot:gene57916-biopygen33119
MVKVFDGRIPPARPNPPLETHNGTAITPSDKAEALVRFYKERCQPGERLPQHDDIDRELQDILQGQGLQDETADVPKSWRRAIIYPLLKPGRDITKCKSYRPVSLTNTIAKLCDRLAASRTTQLLEAKGADGFRSAQAAYRKFRMGEENAVTLSTAIQQGFERGEVTLAVFADAAGAFDKVDHASLLVKMHRMGVPLPMLKWFKAFLTKRAATVRWGVAESAMHDFDAGAPQGTCCGPVCWLVMGNDFNAADLQFADDQLVYVQAKTIAHCVELMNHKMKEVERWVKQWRIPLNMDKTMEIVFSPKPRPHPTTTAKMWIKDTTQLGITWRDREVLRVQPASRAHRAGIRQGMHVTAIDGVPLEDNDDSTDRMKEVSMGTRAKGSTVALELEARPNVRLFGRQVVYAKVCRYLGVLYSEKHNFAEHVQERLIGFKQ